MAKETKKISINITQKGGTFTSLFRSKKYPSVASIRQLLSNEKARLIHTIKSKEPESVYKLAKLLGRDFKAVRNDIRILEQFGIIELISSHKHGRERLRPIIDADNIVISIDIK